MKPPTEPQTRKLLSWLGLSGQQIRQLEQWAREDEMTLREQVRYVLADYMPAREWDGDA